MRNKLFVVIGIPILVMVIIFTIVWGYQTFFKPDQETQQQLVAQFGEDFFSTAAEEAGSSDIAESTADEETPSEMSPEDKKSAKESAAGAIPGMASASGDVPVKPVTLDEIESKYIPQFESLQALAVNRLDALYAEAVREYKQQSADGTLNRAELAQKYIQAGNMLETSIDSQFYGVLQAMESELAANNLPTDIIAAIKADYEGEKSGKRSQLLANAFN